MLFLNNFVWQLWRNSLPVTNLYFGTYRFSSALAIQWPLHAFCCKMNSIFRQHSVITALLYCLHLSLSIFSPQFPIQRHTQSFIMLVKLLACWWAGFHVLPPTNSMHIFHSCNDCWKWWNSRGFSIAVVYGWSGVLHVCLLFAKLVAKLIQNVLLILFLFLFSFL